MAGFQCSADGPSQAMETLGRHLLGPGPHLHAEESDAGEQVHSGLEVLQAFRAAGWKVVLWGDRGQGRGLGENLPFHPPQGRSEIWEHQAYA